MNKKGDKKRFNNLKKSIKGFIKDEDGFVNKHQILKIGLGSVSSLCILSSLSSSYAATVYMQSCASTSHANLRTHENGLYCQRMIGTTCTRCYTHSNAIGRHINHSSSSQTTIHGTGCLSGKGCAGMNIHCPA
jgi:hypothetical protein